MYVTLILTLMPQEPKSMAAWLIVPNLANFIKQHLVLSLVLDCDGNHFSSLIKLIEALGRQGNGMSFQVCHTL